VQQENAHPRANPARHTPTNLRYPANMYGFRRPLWVLWLLLALLPLRGWAGAAMHLPGAAADAAAAVQVAMPCHGEHGSAPAQHDAAAPDGVADKVCALCDLCHGCGALADTGGLHEPLFGPDGMPHARAGALPSLQPDALFRPPRH
jgi:hypothetical protein